MVINNFQSQWLTKMNILFLCLLLIYHWLARESLPEVTSTSQYFDHCQTLCQTLVRTVVGLKLEVKWSVSKMTVPSAQKSLVSTSHVAGGPGKCNLTYSEELQPEVVGMNMTILVFYVLSIKKEIGKWKLPVILHYMETLKRFNFFTDQKRKK